MALALPAVAVLASACGGSGLDSGGSDGDFPSKPVEWVIPYEPGGPTDVVARTVADGAAEHLPNGQEFTVVNKPGGGGGVALTALQKAQPDGYTIASATVSNSVDLVVEDQVDYTISDFQPISMLFSASAGVVVKADSPLKTFDDWVASAKENPGDFKLGLLGDSPSPNIADVFQQEDLDVNNVPYEGFSEATTALLGGHVDGAALNITNVADQIEKGDLRVLFYTTDMKSDVAPDAPRLSDFDYSDRVQFSGVIGPDGIPDEQLDVLNEAIETSLGDSEVSEQLKKMGYEIQHEGPDEFSSIMQADFDYSKKMHDQISK